MKSAAPGSQFGLSKEDWEILRRILGDFAREHRLWVFGSRARGDYREFSDLDILIEGQAGTDELSRLREALSESRLPILVELVPAGELAESFRTQVTQERVELRFA